MGKKEEDIWDTYLQMKKNKDWRLTIFLSNEDVRRVIEKKDFEVYIAKRGELYHKRNCGSLSQSRTLTKMHRSDAILQGYMKCNSCITAFNVNRCLIGTAFLVFFLTIVLFFTTW